MASQKTEHVFKTVAAGRGLCKHCVARLLRKRTGSTTGLIFQYVRILPRKKALALTE